MARHPKTDAQVDFGRRLGAAIQSAREDRQITGEQLAVQSTVGVDAIRSIESGRVASPGIYSVALLAQALETSIDAITPSLGDRA